MPMKITAPIAISGILNLLSSGISVVTSKAGVDSEDDFVSFLKLKKI